MSHPRLVRLTVFAVILIFTALVSMQAYYCISAYIRDSRSRAAAAARGHILARQEWPQTFIDLLKDAEQRHITVREIRVYQMSHDEYYWTSDTSPELFMLMSERWELCAAKDDHKLVRRFQERMPTRLVSSNRPDGIAYYISSNWLAGEKGDLYCVMTDKAKRVIVVRYYYNF